MPETLIYVRVKAMLSKYESFPFQDRFQGQIKKEVEVRTQSGPRVILVVIKLVKSRQLLAVLLNNSTRFIN